MTLDEAHEFARSHSGTPKRDDAFEGDEVTALREFNAT